MARALAQAGWRVDVLGDATGLRRGGGAGAHGPGRSLAALTRTWRCAALPDADVYVDAMLGTGLTRPPRARSRPLAARSGRRGGDGAFYRPRLVAVDAPSGLCLDSGVILGSGRGALPWHALRVAMTVTFDSPKPGHLLEHGPLTCGQLVVADIGLEPFRVQGGRGLRPALKTALWPRFELADRRRAQSIGQRALAAQAQSRRAHKYAHGAALIVAGGAGSGGAARLAARAALRVGAGLVTLAPPAAAMAEHALPPDALMRRTVDDADALAKLASDRRGMALCIGPGCGVTRAAALLEAVRAAARPAVLDADALTALAKAPGALPPDCVLTPHGGEFARLFPDLADQLSTDTPSRPKPAILREAARRIGAVIVLKGPDTVIASPQGRVGDPFGPAYSLACHRRIGGCSGGDHHRPVGARPAPSGRQRWRSACMPRLRGISVLTVADDLPDLMPDIVRHFHEFDGPASLR